MQGRGLEGKGLGKQSSNASDMLIMLYLCGKHKTPSPELCLRV